MKSQVNVVLTLALALAALADETEDLTKSIQELFEEEARVPEKKGDALAPAVPEVHHMLVDPFDDSDLGQDAKVSRPPASPQDPLENPFSELASVKTPAAGYPASPSSRWFPDPGSADPFAELEKAGPVTSSSVQSGSKPFASERTSKPEFKERKEKPVKASWGALKAFMETETSTLMPPSGPEHLKLKDLETKPGESLPKSTEQWEVKPSMKDSELNEVKAATPITKQLELKPSTFSSSTAPAAPASPSDPVLPTHHETSRTDLAWAAGAAQATAMSEMNKSTGLAQKIKGNSTGMKVENSTETMMSKASFGDSNAKETKATSSSPVLVNDAVKSVEVKKSEEAEHEPQRRAAPPQPLVAEAAAKQPSLRARAQAPAEVDTVPFAREVDMEMAESEPVELPAPPAPPAPPAKAARLAGPASFAAFWTQEAVAPQVEKPRGDSEPLVLVQRGQGVDFTKVTPQPEEPSISISEPFRVWEEEDQQAAQQLKDLDRRLRQRARRSIRAESTVLAPEEDAMHRDAMGTSSPWAKLEKEDQRIEETLLNLDDPRRPVDLREYQKLNSMQDDSMAELDGNFAHH